MSALQETLATLKEWNIKGPIETALILGTGLGPIAERITHPVIVPYAQIPHFPHSGVSGHAGRLIAGQFGSTRVLVMQGRTHYYERGDANAMRIPLETLAALGVKTLLLTNASGSLEEAVPPGSITLITDHINLSGINPLIGVDDDSRFVPMVDAYDPSLRAALQRAAASARVALPEGIYQFFPGPSFETPAEIRAAKTLGASLVGMSTVPEVILARRLGLRVAALSMVTNYGAGLYGGAPSHDETKRVAAQAAENMGAILSAYFS